MKAVKSRYILTGIIMLFVVLPFVSAAECNVAMMTITGELAALKAPDLGSPRVVPNPDYVTQTEQERKFTPKEPYSPFDNFRVVMDVSGLAGDGARVANFKASLIAEDDCGKEQIIWESAMHREKIDYSQQLDSGTFVADINGYPNGLGGEELIDAIAKNRKIFIRVERLCPYYLMNERQYKYFKVDKLGLKYEIVPFISSLSDVFWDTSTIADEKAEIPMQGRLTNCAQVYGDGEKKMISMRTKGISFEPYQIVNASKLTVSSLGEVDPFKKYLDKFSFFADLKNHDELTIPGTILNVFNENVYTVIKLSEGQSEVINIKRGSFDLPDGTPLPFDVNYTITLNKYDRAARIIESTYSLSSPISANFKETKDENKNPFSKQLIDIGNGIFLGTLSFTTYECGDTGKIAYSVAFGKNININKVDEVKTEKIIASISSCKYKATAYYFYKRYGEYATFGGITPAITWKNSVFLGGYPDSDLLVHESGHVLNLGNLFDEYIDEEPQKSFFKPWFLGINCVTNPKKEYLYNGALYGDANFIGCSSESWKTRPIYRPSEHSIMDKVESRFNVISCGYILSAIKGGPVKSYFPECMTLDTIKPDCTVNTCPQGFACNTASKLCEKNT